MGDFMYNGNGYQTSQQKGSRTMNKLELIEKVAAKAEITKTEAGKVVNAALDTISETLAEGEKIVLIGFGTFEVRNRAAREGRNPLTKKKIKIPATKVPAFKPGKSLKDAVVK